MTITFPRNKGDQEREHVYANPQNRQIVLFKPLQYTFGCAKRTKFGDTERFNAWLRQMLSTAAKDLILMSIAIIEIGAYSFRKGISKFSCLPNPLGAATAR